MWMTTRIKHDGYVSSVAHDMEVVTNTVAAIPPPSSWMFPDI